ncbi:hypothetical protein SAMN06266787_102173 [Halorubrum ezzemoulense]|uniref:Uncharacterized protein n=1 Tax=Halorubrum ezzemoulense TaxID=337243 RepID=A0A238WCM2_HALEZ|nr:MULTISPECIES: hypothetical protein [Halorubrum]MDB2274820.1 hypothetical protein [Halorubrum ezzemoulense]MDB9279955.1 hypothetical protein [Halorubrum ezzemoulense]MDB9283090.1 hypothetical protein [Halorubrum ezzemoulense]TKX39168.1 hypothetical protein EXE52_10705 [Halorubrum sp. CGM4_25_10-8A]TKX65370.1 hypothetical protein EXE47_07610 [Halorubrum sp. GN12_10-3_MGM]
MTFGDLFERAAALGGDLDEADVRRALDAVRSTADGNGGDSGGDGDSGGEGNEVTDPLDPSPARVVAGADALAADLLLGGDAREALDALRSHAWTTLVASDPLLDDAEAVIASLAELELAADWRDAVEAWREPVAQPSGDHPALASAYRGGAMQVISLDPSLTGPGAAAGLRDRLPVSVRESRAFATVFDPAKLYPDAVGGEYPGPDRDPRTMAPARTDGDQHR